MSLAVRREVSHAVAVNAVSVRAEQALIGSSLFLDFYVLNREARIAVGDIFPCVSVEILPDYIILIDRGVVIGVEPAAVVQIILKPVIEPYLLSVFQFRASLALTLPFVAGDASALVLNRIFDFVGGEHLTFLFKGCESFCIEIVALAEGQRYFEEKRSRFSRDYRIGRCAVHFKLVCEPVVYGLGV